MSFIHKTINHIKYIFLLCILFNLVKSLEIKEYDYEGKELKETIMAEAISYFKIIIKDGSLNKDYLKISVKGQDNSNIYNIISFYQEDSSFITRKQLSQNVNKDIEAEIILNKAQIKDLFYFTVECSTYKCNYDIDILGIDKIEINLNDKYSYSYYVTEENKEMNFTIKGTFSDTNFGRIVGNNVVNIWAKGNKEITSKLDAKNSEKLSEFNAYIIKLDKVENFEYNFQVVGKTGDLINVGVSFFDGTYHNFYPNAINQNINELSGIFKKGVKELNCFKIERENQKETGYISYTDYNNYNIGYMTLLTLYNDEKYFKRCLSISDGDEGFYSIQYIKKNDQNNINIYPPQMLGKEYSRYMGEGDIIQLIPIKPDYDYKYLTYHINVGQGKTVKAYVNSCNNYPLCDINLDNATPIQNLNSFSISLSKKEIDSSSKSPIDKNQKVLIIKCEKGTKSIHTKGASDNQCLIKINMYTDKNEIYLEPYISNYRYTLKDNEENFKIGLQNNQAEYMDLNIEIFSGDLSINVDNVENNYFSFNNKRLYIIKDKQSSVKIKANENSFYHINYVLKNNYAIDYSFTIGANYLFNLIDKSKEIILGNTNNIYDLSYEDNNTVFVSFSPYSCKIDIINTYNLSNLDSKELQENNGFYQDISSDFLKNKEIASIFPIYNYTLTKREIETKECLVGVSFYTYDKEKDSSNTILLSYNSPHLFKFSQDNNIVKYSYPYNSKDNNIVINFSLINQGNYIINVFFNDIKSDKTYEINENKKIIIEQNQFTDKCKYDNQICKISFIVESKNLDVSILQITVSLDDGKEEGSPNNTNGQDTSPISNIVLILIIIGGIFILIIIFTLIYLCIIRKKNKDLSKEVSSISFSNKDEDKDVPLNDV